MTQINIFIRLLIAHISMFILFSIAQPIVAQNIEEKPFAYSSELLDAAEKGDADAMYKIGICYYVGKAGAPTLITTEVPLEQDYKKAFSYLTKAANKNSALAMVNLGNIYKSGVGAPKGQDLKLALEWYEKAAKKGCADAYANIAKIYETDYLNLITQKIVKFKSEESSTALYVLWAKAVEYNKLAADNGSSIGAYNLGIVYKVGQLGLAIDYQEANNWFRRSMELGNRKAVNDLAVHYITGIGIPQNKRFGLELLKQAATDGEPMALHNMGVFYYNGLYNLPQDKEKALLFFLKANSLGYSNAQALSECYVAGIHNARNYATEKDWLSALKKECDGTELPSIEIPAIQTVYKVAAGNVVNDCGSWSIINNDGISITDRRYDAIVQDPATGILTAGLYGYSTELDENGNEVYPILEQMVNSLEGEENMQNVLVKTQLLLQADHDNSTGYRSIAYYNLAVIWKNSGNATFAETYLKKALEFEPDFTAAKEDLALLQEEAKVAKKKAKQERRAMIWKCITTGLMAATDMVGQIAANKQANANNKAAIADANRQKNKERIRQLKERGKEIKRNMVGMISRRGASNAYTEYVGQLTDLKNNGQYGTPLFRQIQQNQKRLAEEYGLSHHESENW